jgi:hypothetical protein
MMSQQQSQSHLRFGVDISTFEEEPKEKITSKEDTYSTEEHTEPKQEGPSRQSLL